MGSVISGLLPVFILIFLGTAFVDSSSGTRVLASLEQLTYYVLFPSLLVSQISGATVDWLRAGLCLPFSPERSA